MARVLELQLQLQSFKCSFVQVSNILLGKSGDISSEGMKRLGQSINEAHLWMYLAVKEKSDAVKRILHRHLEC